MSQPVPVEVFEWAANAVVEGDLPTLKSLLDRHPGLVRARSSKPHGASLLHYSATNGVEDERQRVPAGAVEIARLLIARGADIYETSGAYGGDTGALVALVTSGHPIRAGVMNDLIEAFASGGQPLDGLHEDGAPLLLAILFRNIEGARTLVRLGAQTRDAIAWAALGDVGRLEAALTRGNPPKADVPGTVGRSWAPADGVATAEWALIGASLAGERAAVELLLERGVAPDGTWSHGTTALHEAACAGNADIVRILLAAGASTEVRDKHHDSTPLGWARHAGHAGVVALLEGR